MSAQLQDQLQDQLHKQLDILFASLEKEWDSPMVFSLHLGVDCATNSTTHQVAKWILASFCQESQLQTAQLHWLVSLPTSAEKRSLPQTIQV